MRWEIIEELDGVDGSSAVLVTRVPHGRRIDDEISHTIPDGSEGWDDYYSHRDDLNTLFVTTDFNGDAVERYEYGDYGDVRFTNAYGSARTDTQVEATALFTGRRPIAGRGTSFRSGLLDYRNRAMDPGTGRFWQRDPMGAWYDKPNLGNAYTYVGSRPQVATDSSGLCGTLNVPLVITGPQQDMNCYDYEVLDFGMSLCNSLYGDYEALGDQHYRGCRAVCESAYTGCMMKIDPHSIRAIPLEAGCDFVRDVCQWGCRAAGAGYMAGLIGRHMACKR
jgi:RHS repeat-associated protein